MEAPLHKELRGSQLEPHFSCWMDRMTRDGLRDKADLACVLAWQSARIAELERLIEEAPHAPGCMGQVDVRCWPQFTKIIGCSCFKRKLVEAL